MIFHADQRNLHGFSRGTTEKGTTVYTDQHRGYLGMRWSVHESINHGAWEYVRRQIHTNGIESFWSMLKRGHDGVYHHMNAKHLRRCVGEFSGRHNVRPLDTEDQMVRTVLGTVGKRLRCDDLVA